MPRVEFRDAEGRVLEVQGLIKRYREVVAVDGVSFRVGRGESVGLLGPNGAGKTTTVSIISGLCVPDAGRVLFDGRELQGDSDPTKRLLGLVPQELALYDELSAEQNLRLFGTIARGGREGLAEAVDEAFALVGLTERRRHLVKTFSGGMKRRLNLAASLMHDPQLILLDEPTVGIDPQSRNAIFENLEALRARGKSIVYTTHYMEEVERLCDRVVIIDRGRVVADDTLRGLHRLNASSNRLTIEVEADEAGPWLGEVRAVAGISEASFDAGRLELVVDPLTAAGPALEILGRRGVTVLHVASDRPNLEALFLNLTGRSLRDS